MYNEMLLLLTHTSLFAVVIVAPKLGRQKPEIHMLPLALISGLCLSICLFQLIQYRYVGASPKTHLRVLPSMQNVDIMVICTISSLLVAHYLHNILLLWVLYRILAVMHMQYKVRIYTKCSICTCVTCVYVVLQFVNELYTWLHLYDSDYVDIVVRTTPLFIGWEQLNYIKHQHMYIQKSHDHQRLPISASAIK